MKKRFWFDSKINVHCTQNTYPTIEDLLHKFSQQLKLKVEVTFSISSAKTDVKVVTNLRIPWVAKYRTNLSRKGKRPFIFWILIFPFDSLSLTLVYNSSQFRIYIHFSLRNIQILLKDLFYKVFVSKLGQKTCRLSYVNNSWATKPPPRQPRQMTNTL